MTTSTLSPKVLLEKLQSTPAGRTALRKAAIELQAEKTIDSTLKKYPIGAKVRVADPVNCGVDEYKLWTLVGVIARFSGFTTHDSPDVIVVDDDGRFRVIPYQDGPVIVDAEGAVWVNRPANDNDRDLWPLQALADAWNAMDSRNEDQPGKHDDIVNALETAVLGICRDKFGPVEIPGQVAA